MNSINERVTCRRAPGDTRARAYTSAHTHTHTHTHILVERANEREKWRHYRPVLTLGWRRSRRRC